MKFIVNNQGDSTVGISGFNVEVSIPNIGYPEDDFIKWCKDFLKDIYDAETSCIVYTLDEWNYYQDKWLYYMNNVSDILKTNEVIK